jgi:hypothetical protein
LDHPDPTQTFGLGSVFAELRFLASFLLCYTLFCWISPLHALKTLLKILEKFLCVLDHFLDIFVMMLCVKSWLKNVWYFLVICLLFFLLNLWSFRCSWALKILKKIHEYFLLFLWYFYVFCSLKILLKNINTFSCIISWFYVKKPLKNCSIPFYALEDWLIYMLYDSMNL